MDKYSNPPILARLHFKNTNPDETKDIYRYRSLALGDFIGVDYTQQEKQQMFIDFIKKVQTGEMNKGSDVFTEQQFELYPNVVDFITLAPGAN